MMKVRDLEKAESKPRSSQSEGKKKGERKSGGNGKVTQHPQLLSPNASIKKARD